MSRKLEVLLSTSLSLVSQFQSTLTITAATSSPDDKSTTPTNTNDPLPLLSNSATVLKSHVTKLSLLTITAPFTPSAICTPLSVLNESVLPSLVTAALLITPTEHTKAFQTELRILTDSTLKELVDFLKNIELVAKRETQKALSKTEKDIVTVAAGRVWEACDTLIDVATKGVVGFVIRRVEQYRDLVRDAVEEIEEWDPDEEGDEFFDELLSDDGDAGEKKDDSEDDDDNDEANGEESAALHAQKKTTLRVLKPIAQIYPTIVASRLKKTTGVTVMARKLESLLKNLQLIPEHIDEVAGALYESNVEKSSQYLRKASKCAREAISLVILPWGVKEDSGNSEPIGDKFTTWSKTWLKVMEEVGKSIDDAK